MLKLMKYEFKKQMFSKNNYCGNIRGTDTVFRNCVRDR